MENKDEEDMKMKKEEKKIEELNEKKELDIRDMDQVSGGVNAAPPANQNDGEDTAHETIF